VYQDKALPALSEVSAAVVTGSASMVTEREPWSERTGLWLRDAVAAELPVLGICYGHQLLAQTFGGEVADNPRGRNIGTIDVRLTEEGRQDALFGGFEDVLHMPVSHLQAVTRLPEGARRLAVTERDDNHAFALSAYAWGVQFHPEFDAQIVRGYIDARKPEIEAEGLPAEELKERAVDTAHGTLLLRRFAQIVRRKLRE
jgi:GMP synthase (glutamine-hydrolysing)